jgi:response regulator of citrate/malate metabolism
MTLLIVEDHALIREVMKRMVADLENWKRQWCAGGPKPSLHLASTREILTGSSGGLIADCRVRFRLLTAVFNWVHP